MITTALSLMRSVVDTAHVIAMTFAENGPGTSVVR